MEDNYSEEITTQERNKKSLLTLGVVGAACCAPLALTGIVAFLSVGFFASIGAFVAGIAYIIKTRF